MGKPSKKRRIGSKKFTVSGFTMDAGEIRRAIQRYEDQKEVAEAVRRK